MLTKTKTVIILAATFLMAPNFLNGQVQEERNIDALIEAKHSYKVNYNYEEIEGSPYLKKDFSESIIYYSDKNKNVKKPLRYNLFTGKFEMKSDNFTYVLNKDEKVGYIKYLGEVYKLLNYKTEDGKKQKGYLIQLVEGNYPLYKKIKVQYFNAQEPTSGYDTYEPPKFKRMNDSYFIGLSKDEIIEIESYWKRKFLRLYFKDQKSEFLDYMKDNNINLRNEDELIKFFQYLNK